MNESRNEAPGRLTRRHFIRHTAAGAATAAAALSGGCSSGQADSPAAATRSYNPDMEYRRLGKTGLWISAVGLGGHWKRIETIAPNACKDGKWLDADLTDPDFEKNRYDVVSRCIERGINFVDACARAETLAYAKALKGRREAMYLGFSWFENEARKEDRRTAESLIQGFDEALHECRLDHVDLWRITCIAFPRKHDDGTYSMAHSMAESEEIAKALDMARKAGKARHTGVSSHDRTWLSMMMETFPGQIEAIVTPYTPKSQVSPTDSMFDVARAQDCGILGVKPFASNALFKGDSSPHSPDSDEDDRRARLALRYILGNPAITAPIPGMITPHQVDNAAKAVQERRELDAIETHDLEEAMNVAWATLPTDYQWLKNWEYV